jgi:hypothetical protein
VAKCYFVTDHTVTATNLEYQNVIYSLLLLSCAHGGRRRFGPAGINSVEDVFWHGNRAFQGCLLHPRQLDDDVPVLGQEPRRVDDVKEDDDGEHDDVDGGGHLAGAPGDVCAHEARHVEHDYDLQRLHLGLRVVERLVHEQDDDHHRRHERRRVEVEEQRVPEQITKARLIKLKVGSISLFQVAGPDQLIELVSVTVWGTWTRARPCRRRVPGRRSPARSRRAG